MKMITPLSFQGNIMQAKEISLCGGSLTNECHLEEEDNTILNRSNSSNNIFNSSKHEAWVAKPQTNGVL